MTDDRWQIEQECPQCGAPVTLEETDRLLACPYCRTRLLIAADDPYRYVLPPAATHAGAALFYLPYWRLRGSLFSISPSGVTCRFIDTNRLAVALPEAPHSLGLRPQVLKLHVLAPTTEGRFVAPDQPVAKALRDCEPSPSADFLPVFLGEKVSVIFSPLYLRRGVLYDAVLDRPLEGGYRIDLDGLTPSPPKGTAVRFFPTLCPDCGWDMEGKRDSLVLLCRNCNRAWECGPRGFEEVGFTVLRPSSAEGESALYLPFWRMKPRIEGMQLTTYADFIRAAYLPDASAAGAADPLHFWSPAFKVNPRLYSRWARQMTAARPRGPTDERLPKTALYPVTLSVAEAAEGIVVTLAQSCSDARSLYPRIAGLKITLEEHRLEYHPFLRSGGDWIHASLRLALNGTALAYGLGL